MGKAYRDILGRTIRVCLLPRYARILKPGTYGSP